jgi:toxin-antitoxin system PIN domain toxin
MKYLLDVNVLLAGIWENHPHHDKAFAWLANKNILLCPLAELGFLRISANPKVMNTSMEKAKEMLKRFMDERKTGWIPDDLPVLQSDAKKTNAVTDIYLANLAAKHGAKLATFDGGIFHSAVEII